MFQNLLLISLLSQILISTEATVYLTGSDDQLIKLWDDNVIIKSINIFRKVTCLDIDFERYSIIAGTDNGKVVSWNIINNSTIIDKGSEISKINSILFINSSHCLAGYNGFIIFWSLPELNQIKSIYDSRFGTIGEMKYLGSDNIILIINQEKYIIIFSLNDNSIHQVNFIYEEGFSFDVI